MNRYEFRDQKLPLPERKVNKVVNQQRRDEGRHTLYQPGQVNRFLEAILLRRESR